MLSLTTTIVYYDSVRIGVPTETVEVGLDVPCGLPMPRCVVTMGNRFGSAPELLR